MDDIDINQVASAVLGRRLAGFGFSHSEAVSDVDYDGTSIIRIKATYTKGPIRESKSLIEAVDEIRSNLLGVGESRFVFLKNEYEGQEIETSEEDESPSRGVM